MSIYTPLAHWRSSDFEARRIVLVQTIVDALYPRNPLMSLMVRTYMATVYHAKTPIMLNSVAPTQGSGHSG